EPAVRAVENGQEVGARVPADGRSEALEVRLKAELPLETRRGRTERLREHQTIGPANGSPPGAGGSSGPGAPPMGLDASRPSTARWSAAICASSRSGNASATSAANIGSTSADPSSVSSAPSSSSAPMSSSASRSSSTSNGSAMLLFYSARSARSRDVALDVGAIPADVVQVEALRVRDARNVGMKDLERPDVLPVDRVGGDVDRVRGHPVVLAAR